MIGDVFDYFCTSTCQLFKACATISPQYPIHWMERFPVSMKTAGNHVMTSDLAGNLKNREGRLRSLPLRTP